MQRQRAAGSAGRRTRRHGDGNGRAAKGREMGNGNEGELGKARIATGMHLELNGTTAQRQWGDSGEGKEGQEGSPILRALDTDGWTRMGGHGWVDTDGAIAADRHKVLAWGRLAVPPAPLVH